MADVLIRQLDVFSNPERRRGSDAFVIVLQSAHVSHARGVLVAPLARTGDPPRDPRLYPTVQVGRETFAIVVHGDGGRAAQAPHGPRREHSRRPRPDRPRPRPDLHRGLTMADILNLRLARKNKARAEKEKKAAENRAAFGRPKAEAARSGAEAKLADRRLDAHRLGRDDGER